MTLGENMKRERRERGKIEKRKVEGGKTQK
jgi:hypothetical protein